MDAIFIAGGLIPYPLKCMLDVLSSGLFSSPRFPSHTSTGLLSAPNRCRRTDDDAPTKGLSKAISLFVRQRMQKLDRRERILDCA